MTDDRHLALSTTVRVGRVSRIAVGRRWILQNRNEALSLEMLGTVKLAQFTERRIEIHQFDQGLAVSGNRLHSRMTNDQGNPRVTLEIGVLAPTGMVPQFPTVVGPEHDNRVFRSTGFFESIKQHADIPVGVAHTGVIAMNQPLAQGNRKLFGCAGQWNVAVGPEFTGIHIPCVPGITGRHPRVVGQCKAVSLVQVPVLFRGHEWKVRLGEANSQKEWLSGCGKLLEPGGSNSRTVAVKVIPIRNVGRFGGRPASPAIPFSSVLQTRRIPILLAAHLDPLGPVVRVNSRAHFSVVDLPQANRRVTIALEMLIERDDFCPARSPIGDVKRPFPSELGVKAGHQGNPTGPTDRLIAIGPVELETGRSQAVDIGRLGTSAITPQFRPQIVNRDEEDIRSRRTRFLLTGKRLRETIGNEDQDYERQSSHREVRSCSVRANSKNTRPSLSRNPALSLSGRVSPWTVSNRNVLG